MSLVSQPQSFTPPAVGLPATPSTQRPSRLLAGIYHDIGMAAVAISLEIPLESLAPAEHEAVKRGSRYIYLMPKRQDPPPRPSAE